MSNRCNNCGWENAASRSSCEKCNEPLKGGSFPAQQSPDDSDTHTGGASDSTPSSSKLKGTVTGKPATGVAWDADWTKANNTELKDPSKKSDSKKKNEENLFNCPKCKYANIELATHCVSCGAKLIHEMNHDAEDDAPAARPHPIINKPEVRRPDFAGPKAPFTGTISPWMKVKSKSFTLTPIPRENENLNIKLEFDEDQVELNRANLDPKNNTITSKLQAVIVHKEGKWYLSNHSAMQTTFIRVNEEVELKKGDIILMGDRMFEFDD
jgi:hypothetical protein